MMAASTPVHAFLEFLYNILSKAVTGVLHGSVVKCGTHDMEAQSLSLSESNRFFVGLSLARHFSALA